MKTETPIDFRDAIHHLAVARARAWEAVGELPCDDPERTIVLDLIDEIVDLSDKMEALV